eukprot:1358527-Rhodomonas_salina.2
MLHRAGVEGGALAGTNRVERDQPTALHVGQVLLAHRERDLDVPDVYQIVRVLLVDHDEAHVDVLEDWFASVVLVDAVRRHSEEAGLLQVDVDLRQEGVERHKFSRAEVGQTEEGVDGVLDADASAKLAGLGTELHLIEMDPEVKLAEERIHQGEHGDSRGGGHVSELVLAVSLAPAKEFQRVRGEANCIIVRKISISVGIVSGALDFLATISAACVGEEASSPNGGGRVGYAAGGCLEVRRAARVVDRKEGPHGRSASAVASGGVIEVVGQIAIAIDLGERKEERVEHITCLHVGIVEQPACPCDSPCRHGAQDDPDSAQVVSKETWQIHMKDQRPQR